MSDDGAIDFSGYSLSELREVERVIDRHKYPINAARLDAEIASRGVEIASSASSDEASDGLGAYYDFKQTLGAVALIVMGVVALVSGEITLGEETRKRGQILRFLLGGERSFEGKALVLLAMGMITAGCAFLADALGLFGKNQGQSRFRKLQRPLFVISVSLFVAAVALR